MRVVGNAADPDHRRRGDRVTIDGIAETVPGAVASSSGAARDVRLPLLPALLFLVACIGGGIAVALFAPLGNG